MTASHEEIRALHQALMAAFPQPGDLELVLALDLGRLPQDIAPPNTTRPMAYFRFIQAASAEGWFDPLVAAAARAVPGNAALAALAAGRAVPKEADIHRPAARDAGADAEADSTDAERQSALQRLVNANDPSADALALLAGQQAMLGRVGAIEWNGSHQGTCILVDHDKVLTNDHVIRPLRSFGPDTLEVRFDHLKDASGALQEGWTVPVADDWLLKNRPHGTADTTDDPNDVPEPLDLDYALVRLTAKPTDRAGPDGAARTPVQLDRDAKALTVSDHVTIIQHPMGAPIHIAYGHVLSLGGQNLRVRYSANTKKGSSGAAVLNHKGALVALHHAGDPNFAAELADYNQGIPIALIAADLAAAGLLPDIAGAA
ncbi:MAG: trypsin-like peptidase domain-containing protein [Pseudomonadota bacterium]